MYVAPSVTRPLAVGALAALGAALLYGLTMDTGLGYGDAAELALKVHERGVTHPPGYPLYVFLGSLLTPFASEPAVATAWLSAGASVLTVGVLAALTAAWTGAVGGVFAGLLFAVYPYTWEAATNTEIYNVNAAVVAVATALLAWPGAPRGRRLVAGGLVAAASLGTSPANALLFPGWLVLLGLRSRPAWRGPLVTCLGGAVLCGLCVYAWTVSRAPVSPPLGTPVLPADAVSFLRYVTGVDYGVLAPRPAMFYLTRTFAHPFHFAADMAFVGVVLSLVGVGVGWRRHPVATGGLVLMAAGNLGYFTYHIWPDYRAMVTPATFLACGFAGAGVHAWLGTPRVSLGTRRIVTGLLVVGVPFTVGLRGLRYVRDVSPDRPAGAYVAEAFEALPDSALVLAPWKSLTPLLYVQRVRGEREDLLLIEVADGPRNGPEGPILDWRPTVATLADTRPVFTNVPAVRRATGWHTTPFADVWWRVSPE